MNLLIPDLPQYNEDIVDNKYGMRVPIQIGTLVIEHLLLVLAMEGLQQADDTWKQVHLSTAISIQNTASSSDVPEYDLEQV